MTPPPDRHDAETWAKELVERWLQNWNGRGLGNFVVEDECMVDLTRRLTTLHAQAVAALKEEWMLYVGQPGDPTYEALVKENIRLRAEMAQAVREEREWCAKTAEQSIDHVPAALLEAMDAHRRLVTEITNSTAEFIAQMIRAREHESVRAAQRVAWSPQEGT